MRRDRFKKLSAYTVFGGLFLVFYFLQYTGLLPAIGAANAAPLVPLTVLVALQYREWQGALFGLIAGCLMDIMGAGSACFNTLSLFLLGCLAGILVKYYVNSNTLSAVALLALFSLLYFLAKWLVFYAGHIGAGGLFLWSLGSAAYTAGIGILIYFVLRLIFRRQEVKRI